MNAITRCPTCATKFKVTPEQLRVSEGWVRCGRCNSIFDAQSHLEAGATQAPSPARTAPGFEHPADAGPLDWRAYHADALSERPTERWLKELSETFSPTASPAPESRLPAADADDVAPEPSASPDAADSFEQELQRWQAQRAREAQTAASAPPQALPPITTAPTSPDAPDRAAAPLHMAAPDTGVTLRKASADTAGASAPAPASIAPVAAASTLGAHDEKAAVRSDRAAPRSAPQPQQDATAAPPQDPDDAGTDAAKALRFVREAERKAFWRRPAVRAVLWLAAFVLLALLTLQLVVQQRDRIAARSPAWQARMQALCERLQCRITPLQQLDQLVLDGSTFQVEGPGLFTLSWSVRNRSDLWLQTPSLMLSLRDAQGQTLLRRSFDVTQLQGPAMLAPGAAWQGRQALQVTVQPQAIAGYQLTIFYPDPTDSPH
ncbi:hypothetical protein AAV94_01790 [Lampropedia cohaerens]|uniref:Zinc finger/thioredoxin putative domain-containing protein n=1 Tax=Lampropedia cohaerens TaxID=1610491 RepID=A0A0U1Q2Z9_9BURK|nr:zinc-ribbon and DUF3426 domain-containing protein [Lampropedia cohaerens]KKW69143.1 hypothetical protein AAV94_01790 [Lampropedia cohaerens]